METKLSIYIPIHNHPGLLKYVLDSCVGVADELIIVDGAYEGMRPWFNTLGADPAKSNKETLDIIDSYKDRIDVVYFDGVWKDEPDKHLFAYNKCKNNLVLTVDSDEAFVIYPEELEKFAISGKFAGTVTEKVPVTAEYSIDFPGTKRKIFNKVVKNTVPHYDYLPLLRDCPANVDYNTVYSGVVGHLCHLVSFRPPTDRYNRTIMYHGINKRSPEGSAGAFGDKILAVMSPETHKSCYVWDLSLHSVHSYKEFDVVASRDFPLFDVAQSAYAQLIKFNEEEVNLLDIKEIEGIPIRCDCNVQLDASAFDGNNVVELRIEDILSGHIPYVAIKYRVLHGNKIVNIIYKAVKIEATENIGEQYTIIRATLPADLLGDLFMENEEILHIMIVLNIKVHDKLFIYIKEVTYGVE